MVYTEDECIWCTLLLIKDGICFIKSQQHRCSKGIVDVSHNIVTASACFDGFVIAFLNCEIIYLDSLQVIYSK